MENTERSVLREAFFNRSHDVLLIFDKNFHITDANDTFLQSLRLKREQVIGKHMREINPGIEDTDRYKIYREVLLTGVTAEIAEVKSHPSLGQMIGRVRVFKVGDGLGISASNLTDAREASDELETFIYKTSHDLRSPILSIMGLTNLSEKGLDSLETAMSYLTMIGQQVKKLDSILFKLSEITRIRKGGKVNHLIDFGQVVQDVRSHLINVDGFDKVHFEVELLARQKFYSDKLLIVSLMQNLLDNAVKYRNESILKSVVKIRVTDEHSGLRITVTDNGIGIPEYSQPEVFKMFFRANNKKPGAGLGLYTVSQVIKKLEGHISLMSKEGEGTTFYVYLPNAGIS